VRTAGPTEFWDQGGWSTGVEQHEIRTDRRGLGLLERLRPTNVHDLEDVDGPGGGLDREANVGRHLPDDLDGRDSGRSRMFDNRVGVGVCRQ
jgi:hypothetical protein